MFSCRDAFRVRAGRCSPSVPCFALTQLPRRLIRLPPDSRACYFEDCSSTTIQQTNAARVLAGKRMNPIERVWAYLRSHYLSNRVYRDYDELFDETAAAWNRLDEPTLK